MSNHHKVLNIILLIIFILGCNKPNELKDTGRLERKSQARKESKHHRADEGLTEKQRSLLWETESVAFKLSYRFGTKFAEQLAKRDRQGIIKFLADSFSGSVPDHAPTTLVDQGPVLIKQLSASSGSLRNVDASQFANAMVSYTEGFSSGFFAGLYVLNVAPVSVETIAGPWQATFLIKLAGATNESSIDRAAAEESDGFYVPNFEFGSSQPAHASIKMRGLIESLPNDFAGDSHWISKLDVIEASFSRSQYPLMADITDQLGIDTASLHDNWRVPHGLFRTNSGGIYSCEINGDDHPDLIVTNVNSGCTIYQNTGKGRFKPLEIGLPPFLRHSLVAGAADFDNDNDDDLVVVGFEPIWMAQIFENEDGAFRDRTVVALGSSITGVSFADYNRDGLVDMYFTAASSSDLNSSRRTAWIGDESGNPNQLFRNNGAFKFEDVTDAANAGAGNSSTFSAVWFDANQDLWPDLYVINELGSNTLLINQQDGAFAVGRAGPDADGFAMGVTCGDFDGDSRVDIYVGNMRSKMGMRILANVPEDAYSSDIFDTMRSWVEGNKLLLNKGSARFASMMTAPPGGGWSYGPAAIDLDNDGMLDLYSPCGFASRSRREPDN